MSAASKTSQPHVCALLPAFNEGDRIAATIAALRSRREIHSLVVVDDGSADDTFQRAQDAGADIVLRQRNQGKGAALAAAYHAAGTAPDIYLLLDSDLGPSASEAAKLLQPLLRDEADMVVGLLPPDPEFAATGQSGGMGLVVGLARWGIRRRTGKVFQQPLCGQRAVRRCVLEAVSGKFAPGFGVEAALTIAALAHGFRVVETPTEFRHKVTGSNWAGKMHRARQFRDVLRVLLSPTPTYPAPPQQTESS